ncbi:MAG: serine/threonine-protein kinase PknK [Chloroflexi bacterium]|nr:serine/threonine-protein kinase PknK [Chloroflexota bacterium]
MTDHNQPKQTDPLTIGQRYLLHEQMAIGGMGIIYRATDRLTGTPVALKRVTIPTDHLAFTSRSGDTSLALSLTREFKTLASLHHPNIISVLDYGFDEQRCPFFTMTLLENAQTIVQASRGRDTQTKINLLVQVLQALSYLHRQGVLHRDLKPENVLVISDNDQVQVLDFGLSVITSRTMEDEIQSVVGTFPYMAPELFQDEPMTTAADLYALGVVAYEIFAGRCPFEAQNAVALVLQILNEPVNVNAIGVNGELALVLAQLLTKKREERYDDANRVIRDLCQATGQPLLPETIETRESFLQAAKFVGRDAELARLSQSLDAALAGQGSAWLIGGESGVGKSRLADELRTLALVQGAPVLHGQAVREGGTPYDTWRNILRWLALASDLSLTEASVLKPFVSDITNLLGVDVPDPYPLDPQMTQTRLFHVVSEVFNSCHRKIAIRGNSSPIEAKSRFCSETTGQRTQFRWRFRARVVSEPMVICAGRGKTLRRYFAQKPLSQAHPRR